MGIKQKIKSILLPIACRTFLAPPGFAEPPANVRRIGCRREEAELLVDTSNNVFRIRTDGKTMYFRECKVRREISRYVQDDVNLYYTHLHPELQEDRRFVEQALADPAGLKAFAGMGMINDTTSGAWHFCMGHGGHHVGLQDASPETEERLKDFVQYIWGDLFAYTLNGGMKVGQYQTYNAARSIASRRMAELLGVPHLIPETEYALLCFEDGTSLFGTIMAEAPGICMEKTSCAERRGVLSPDLQRALNQLNLLDVLCLERDHRVGNYNVLIQEGRAVAVQAFDNDSPNAFGMGGISFRTYMGCSPWAVDGRLNRPYVDRRMAEAICSLDLKEAEARMKDLLHPMQIFALKQRIRAVQKILRDLPRQQLLEEAEWDAHTMEEELSGNYGDTYLVKFLQEQKLMPQPWIKGR